MRIYFGRFKCDREWSPAYAIGTALEGGKEGEGRAWWSKTRRRGEAEDPKVVSYQRTFDHGWNPNIAYLL